MKGYDSWKTTDPADNTLGRSNGQPVRYACLECAWRGRGSLEQQRHWRATGHTTVPVTDPRVTTPERKASA